MSDPSLVSIDGEMPVNPYSLMEAVNATSAEARRGWFVFLALMGYLVISVAGIGHKDLLLARDVPLPLIQVRIDLQRFFLFAPIVLCFLHFGFLMQHALLARKVLKFNRALRTLESTAAPRHPLRLELHSYFFTQSLAGPERSPLMSFFLHLQAWLTLVALPVLLLIYIQVSFLPFHDVEITWAQRIVLLIDCALVAAIGIFFTRLDVSFLGAMGRTLVHQPVISLVTALLFVGVSLFSFLSATIPGEALDRLSPRVSSSMRRAMAKAFPLLRDPHADTAFGFRRNLVVMDTDLVDDKAVTPGQMSLNLRGRDLRSARLDRSDMHQADFTGAILDGANLTGANLKGAALGCQELSDLRSGNRRAANCTSLRGANLARVQAAGAHLSGADISGASFIEAHLEGAELNEAQLPGANFWQAHLERAEFTAAALQGANFLQAQAQGAYFFGAGLQAADFTAARLQGAVFRNAMLQGASLSEADLDGAEMAGARLTGARMSGAKLFGVDLQGARIWQTVPPARETSELADLFDVRIRPPDDSELNGLKSMLDLLTDSPLRARVAEALTAVLDSGSRDRWRSAPDQAAWQSLASVHGRADGDAYRSQLTAFLGNLGCRPRWSSGSVATGIALRANASRFKGNGEMLYTRFSSSECAASKSIPAKVMQDMSAAIDEQKGMQATINTLSSRGSGDQPSGTLSGPFPLPSNSGRDR
jgi:uncharacterized protein YjbI with pentapeptide repeats